ncbi:hypothetical protein H4Q26_010622 [Puccinia striiformis f. sp. tritici PST-130]|nr:hypothetical protein H4Q26_010622 [Puccinia striiformis f. sp. tritici PST-130]
MSDLVTQNGSQDERLTLDVKAPATVGLFDPRQTAALCLMPLARPLQGHGITGPSLHHQLTQPALNSSNNLLAITLQLPVTSTSLHHHQLTDQPNMISGFYAACFLAAFAAATPIEHQARQISSFNQVSGSGQQATSNSQPGYAGLCPRSELVGNMQGMLAQGTMTQAIAMSSMNQLVGQLQPVMSNLIGCGCIGGGGIGSMFNNVFGQITQVVQGLQTNFPGAGFNSLMMPFGQMLPTMQSFVSSFSQNTAFSSYAQTLNPS